MISNPKDLIGQVVSGYKLERILGAGATGAVFFGQKVDQPAEPVAIKVLILPWQTTDLERDAFQARFRREAQALLELNHPGIPKLLGFGAEPDYDYLVLQYIDNGSLFARLAQGPLPFEEAARYTQQLSNALDYAHAHNLIHRDIKPANVLLDSKGNAYLSDFSIVRLFASDAQKNLTSTGQSIGTPEYMSPEQMRGLETGPTSDIYSLGLLVYQMVTGRVPFEGNTIVDLALKHAQEAPPYPRAFRPDLPPPAEAAIIRALAKNPAERFQTATAFSTAFVEGLQNRGYAPPVPMQTMMPANTSGQYIPPTGAAPTPYPSPTGPTFVPAPLTQQPFMPSPTYAPPTYQGQAPSQKRSTTPVFVGIIAVLVVALVGVGFLALSKSPSGPGGTADNGSAATFTAAAQSTATATLAPTDTAVAESPTPTASTYSAVQPGPGCDTSGGTWTPQGIDNISCGTTLSIDANFTRGYLYLQLPSGQTFASNNRIGVTGTVGTSSNKGFCVGLGELGVNKGYLVEYCSAGSWSIYSIANTGAIIQTLASNVTSTRRTTSIALTLNGTTLAFTIDSEEHDVTGITPIQPTKVAISMVSSNCDCGTTDLLVTNFTYTV